MINKTEKWSKYNESEDSEFWEICGKTGITKEVKILDKSLIKEIREQAVKDFLGTDEGKVYQDYETLKKQAITDFMMEVKNIDIKEHACRFNDGECNCDCYIAGIEAVKENAKKFIN